CPRLSGGSMIRFFSLVFMFVVFVPTIGEAANGPVRVSVVDFENKAAGQHGADNCLTWWWEGSVGSAMADILVDELSKVQGLEVLERQHIQSVHENEHELINSENTPKKPKGMFKTADYTLAGAVSEYEWCN